MENNPRKNIKADRGLIKGDLTSVCVICSALVLSYNKSVLPGLSLCESNPNHRKTMVMSSLQDFAGLFKLQRYFDIPGSCNR